MIFETLSHRYGWTPTEIRAMQTTEIIDYLTIIEARAIIERAESMKNQPT